jgi:hypothetical protein
MIHGLSNGGTRRSGKANAQPLPLVRADGL